MAKAPFSRRTRASILTATAGLSLAVALLPGGASAAPGDPVGRPAADSDAHIGSPAADGPPVIPSQQSLARSDARLTKAEQRPGVRQLRKQLGTQGVLELDPDTGTARQVARLDGYLTSASGANPEDIARNYLRAHPDVFGLSAAQVQDLTLRKQYTDVAGTRHLSFVQSVEGVPVFGNGVKANVARDGRLISVLGSPVRGLPSTLAPAKVSGTQARRNALRDIAGAGDVTLGASDTAKQVVYTEPGGVARRAWRTVTVPDGQGMWLHVVDAATGRVLYRQNLSSDLSSDARPAAPAASLTSGKPVNVKQSTGPLLRTGKVLVWDQYPGARSGGKQHTRHLTARGWLPQGAQTLNGSVGHVFSDVNDNDKVDPGEEITPAADGTFSFPFKPFTGDGCGTPLPCSWDQKTPNSWQTNREQNAAQVFYFLGTFHDHLEAGPIGFTRAAGNFDSRDGDAVQAQTDDGAAIKDGLPDGDHLNNANMGTPPDGQAPTMQMYLTGSIPGFNVLQGNFGDDAATVYHEYTHGLSHRLITDADGVPALNSQQSGAMGEAWSDWYALDFLNNEGLLKDNRRVDGDVNLDAPGWSDELPARTQSMDCPVGATSAKCQGTDAAGPGGYTYGDYGKISSRGGPEVHADGEIWGQTLWDLRNTLGSRLTESLVTRAMELSPVNPSFLDQRNAILQADTVVNGGRAHDRIWKVFAHRGMGWYAAALTGDDVRPDEDFSLPPGPDTPLATLTGKVTDTLSGNPVGGVTVSISGHASGFPGADLSAVSAADGTYAIRNVPEGTYRKVYASGGGYEPQIRTVTVASATADWALRRNWSASSGGAEIAEFSGADYSDFGCGPAGLIDMGGSVWGSEANGGTNGTGVDPVHNTVRLPVAVDVSELRVDPTSGCGDDLTASLGDYRIETSPDGTTWATAAEGHFSPADTGRENVVALNTGTGQNVRYVRVTMLGNQAVDNGVDCAQDSGSSGCLYMDMSELIVNGTARQG
ncbi:M36 family metallopeptidase [Streptomyces sp. NPDC047042]|uniref:M36 family metallopeptidase n=1 Tax=Streptomyces sp. NPDC047042 TaxID=3154807 RepID=UPI00340DAFAE